MSWINALAELGLAVVYPTVAGELNRLRESQWDSPEEIQRRSWQALQATLRYAHTHVAFYREKFDRAGVVVDHIRTPADLEAVPFTTKQELKAALQERWPLSTAVA